MRLTERLGLRGQVRVRHILLRDGRQVPVETYSGPLKPKQIELLRKNLVVNAGRGKIASLLIGSSSTYVNRLTLGDCRVSGVVEKTDFPPDLSDVALVHELTKISGLPAGTFALDSATKPDEVVKVDASVGTPGTLVAGAVSTIEDLTGVDFIDEGVDTRDTVTVYLNGEDFTLGTRSVISATKLEVANPAQLAGSVGYTVQTPGTQALFRKLISGDDFPAADFGPATIVHEAGLLFADGTLFNRVTFAQHDDDIGLVLQPTDADGQRIDVQLDWLITV